MLTISQILQLAEQYYQAGQFSQAEALYRQVLQQDQKNSQAYHGLGLIAYHVQNYPVAVQLIQAAIRFNPTVPEFYNDLSTMLTDQGKLAEAILVLQRAIALAPQDATLYHKLGNLLSQQGQLDQAMTCYQRAVTLNPTYVEVYKNLGIALNKPDLHHEQAIQLALKHHQAGEVSQAEAICQQVLQTEPKHSGALHLLGFLNYQANRHETGIKLLRQAIAINPAEPHIYSNLGIMLGKLGKISEAIDSFQRALTIFPQDELSYNNLGKELYNQGKMSEAIAQFRKALELKPDYAMAHSNLLMALLYTTEYDPATLFLEHQNFNEQQAKPCQTVAFPSKDKARIRHRRDRRLKIGYVSQDFRRHSVAYFIEPILAHHDPQQFDLYCYFNNFTPPDEVTHRLQRYAKHWRNCFELSDEELAAKIRHDKIDILVDLMGHTNKNRLLVFARQPAPVQVAYLGYSNTTGLTSIDYRLTDGYTDPVGIAEQFSSETLIRLPNSYFCYGPGDNAHQITVNSLPALQNGYVTFGSFNNYAKLSPPLLNLWAQLLDKVPPSKLLVKTTSLEDTATRQELVERFANLGISSERLILTGYATAMTDHLRSYNQVDIALDSFPYNGATTTCESLWMGVPVVTLVGETHVSRMGLSILSSLGLTELVGHTPADYLNICFNLAHNLTYLQTLRKTMRARMQTSPLMDAVSFTRHLEAIYRKIGKT